MISLLSKGLSRVLSTIIQFKRINCLVLSLLYNPTLTYAYNYWKNHSLDYMDIYQQSDAFILNTISRLIIPFLSRSSVHSLSGVQLFVTPWTAAHQASLSITNSGRLPKLMPIVLVILSNHLILCHPLLLLPSIFPSIRVFSNESVLPIRWLKYWSFSFSVSPSNEYLGLTSFRMDWLDLLAGQGTLRSLLQHHSSNQFFSTQLSL